MLSLGLASRLGFHPLTKAVLILISTSPPKQPPAGPRQLKIVEICNALVGLCFLYVLETILLGLAWKQGLHPVAIAHLSPDTISLVVSQIPNGGSKDTGREYMNAIHFYPMFNRCVMDKMNHLQLSLGLRELFLSLSRPNLGLFTSCLRWL
jgi:hypothetical protein